MTRIAQQLNPQAQVQERHEPAAPRVKPIPVPRVDNEPASRMKPMPVPRVTTEVTPAMRAAQAAARATQARKRRRHSHLDKTNVILPTKPPALSTRSQVAAAKATAPPTPVAPASKLRQPTRRSKRTGSKTAPTSQANAVQLIHQLEKQVQQALAVMDQDTGKMLKYRQLLKHPKLQVPWKRSSANEFGRLAQGVGKRVKGTDTMRFIEEMEVPRSRRRDVTYGSFVCNVRPEKTDEPNRTRFTVGGDKINYPGEVATPTADMLVAKMLFNSVISTPGAKFMTMDISNFYLMTPLKRPQNSYASS